VSGGCDGTTLEVYGLGPQDEIMQKMCSSRMEFILGVTKDVDEMLEEFVKRNFLFHCTINGHNWYKIPSKAKDEMLKVMRR